ncbi:cytochrome p450 [Apiospora hydei]|uniref:Cytochrome p450 n=1 Tax=Apiospora hydei TaxID=1337664 RepID=A0ABR1V1R5_9PEZI
MGTLYDRGLGCLHALALLPLLLVPLVIVRRLYFSPASNFRGPFLARVSRLYEAYHVLLKDDWYENLKSLHEKYGPVVRIGPNEVHIADPELCLDFHRRPDLEKCSKYYGLVGTVLGGLSEPQSHLQRKTVIQPLFTGDILARYSAGELNVHMENLHEKLTEAASSQHGEEGTNLTFILWALTNDIMTSYIFGERTGYLAASDLAAAHDATRAYNAIDLATVLRTMPPVKILFNTLPVLRRHSVLGWIDKLISTRLARTSKGDSTTQHERGDESILAHLWHELGGDSHLVTHELAQGVFIGNESLLSNLTFLLHQMLENPRCIQALRAELDTLDIGAYGHQVWRDPKVLQLRTHYVASLRASAPRWHRQPRQSTEPVVCKGDTTIPAMVSISFTPRVLERDATLFEDPDSFVPERWLGNNLETQTLRRNSVTFGTGTRTCLGQYIARHVLKKALVCIVYGFDISLLDADRDSEDGFKYLSTYPKKGKAGYMKVRVASRFAAC